MSYLTLKANSSSTSSTFTPDWSSIGTGGMQYRIIGATEWTNAVQGTPITVDTTGIELKADTIQTDDINHFSMTGSISASGDVTSLTNGVGGDCVLDNKCYRYMFQDCAALTAAPTLPSTTLANRCYYGMFKNCTSLTAVPALPATTLAYQCYSYMFRNCSSLIYVSELPATTLADLCYQCMFKGCSSLIGYITSESGYTLIHNYPSTTAGDWNDEMYSSINAASTVPATPSSGVNYYFKPAPQPSSIEGKVLKCIGNDQRSI